MLDNLRLNNQFLNTKYQMLNTKHASRKRASHLSRELYKSNLFLQNEPNSPGVQDDTTLYSTRTYKNYMLESIPKNEPKQSQNEPNFDPILALFFPILASFSAYRIDSFRSVI